MIDYLNIKIQNRKKINPRFKESIKNSREKLLELQSKIQKEEKNGLEFEHIRKKYFETAKDIITQLLMEPDEISHNFNNEEHLIHKEYYRDQLGGLLIPAPLHTRALMKPHGYAGDYEMLNMIYERDPFRGSNSFFKLIHGASCHSIAGRAVLARVPYFTKKISEAIQSAKQNNHSCRILCLSSGPAKEIQVFLETNTLTHDCQFILVDQDKDAIKFCQKSLGEIQNKKQHPIQINYLNHPLINLMQDPPDIISQNGFDLIYSAGLFDYLENNIFNIALHQLFPFLNNQSSMIIGNFSQANYAKTGLWYLDDWALFYREKAELLNLASTLSAREVMVESESTETNLFLIIRK